MAEPTDRPPHAPTTTASEPELDLRERGAPVDGAPQYLDKRLFFQLTVLRVDDLHPVASGATSMLHALDERGVAAVLYDDLADPRGLGVLSWSEDPAHFIDRVRPALSTERMGLRPDPAFSMLGRTYSSGYEKDLAFWLLERPVKTVCNPAWNWAIWYPLRRKGAFNRLEAREQGGILREHGTIGHSFGDKDLAHDVRLACHGLDTHDNDFVIGLVGRDLHPLSAVVQAMRKTRQTAEYMDAMGPFFVGRVRARTRAAGG